MTLTVITVTYNNADGLTATLGSLARLHHVPDEVLVIDGASQDHTPAVLAAHAQQLPLRVISEPDDGIYDAMNKGQRLARGRWLHYLNAGDTVWGEPYGTAIDTPVLLPVRFHDEQGRYLFDDRVKHGGWGYCHQGIVFPREHAPYRTRFHVLADLDAIIATFPQGLGALPMHRGGGVRFDFGGVSNTAIAQRDAELRTILRERLPPIRAWALMAAIEAKNRVPRPLRRRLAAWRARGSILSP